MISGGHIDHNGSELHLCFEKCLPSGCEENQKKACSEESLFGHIFEHIFEKSKNIGKASPLDQLVFLACVNQIDIEPNTFTVYNINTDTDIQSFVEIRTNQTRAPPYHLTTN